MKTFRRLKKICKEGAKFEKIILVFAMPILLVAFALAFAPGIAIAYLSGNKEMMGIAAIVSFDVIGCIVVAVLVIRKIVKHLKREDSKK